MTAFWGEFIGSFLLLLLGNGVVANVILDKTKGQNGGLIAITLGWGIAVFTGVYASVELGGNGHLNPAVSVAQAYLGKISWNEAVLFSCAQLTGAFSGALLTWILYKQHFDCTADPATKLGVFSTSPSIHNPLQNIVSEIIGTFMLVFGALLIAPSSVKLGALDALPVALLVTGIGLSLGGPTGYAINPARDLGPRIVHFLVPIRGKGNSNWGYAWVPVVGPLLGGLIAAVIFQYVHIK